MRIDRYMHMGFSAAFFIGDYAYQRVVRRRPASSAIGVSFAHTMVLGGTKELMDLTGIIVGRPDDIDMLYNVWGASIPLTIASIGETLGYLRRRGRRSVQAETQYTAIDEPPDF